MYRNVICREIIHLPPTKENIKKAAHKRNLILAEIEARTFNYAEYFPNSAKVKLFNPETKKHKMGDLLRKQLADYTAMEAKGNLSIATLNGYIKITNMLVKYFEDIYVEDLTPIQIKEWLEIQGMNNTVTTKTMRNRISLLKMVLEEAKNDRLIQSNPISEISLQRQLNKNTIESDYEVEPFSDTEKEL